MDLRYLDPGTLPHTHRGGASNLLANRLLVFWKNLAPETYLDDVIKLVNYRKVFKFVSAYLEESGPIIWAR